MAYRLIQVKVVASDDQNQTDLIFGPRKAEVSQVKDQKVASIFTQVNPADAEVQLSMAPVATGYAISVFSDYPILLRLNGPSATQVTMTPCATTPVNLGAPIPDQCVYVATINVTSIYVAPVANATRSANVKIMVSGDPLNAYGPSNQ